MDRSKLALLIVLAIPLGLSVSPLWLKRTAKLVELQQVAKKAQPHDAFPSDATTPCPVPSTPLMPVTDAEEYWFAPGRQQELLLTIKSKYEQRRELKSYWQREQEILKYRLTEIRVTKERISSTIETLNERNQTILKLDPSKEQARANLMESIVREEAYLKRQNNQLYELEKEQIEKPKFYEQRLAKLNEEIASLESVVPRVIEHLANSSRQQAERPQTVVFYSERLKVSVDKLVKQLTFELQRQFPEAKYQIQRVEVVGEPDLDVAVTGPKEVVQHAREYCKAQSLVK